MDDNERDAVSNEGPPEPAKRKSGSDMDAAVRAWLRAQPWYEDYRDLRAQKLDWRKAAWVAWQATPKRDREPKTLTELADLLGVADRTMRGWATKNPALPALVAKMQMAPLFEHRRDIIEALILSATNPAAQNSADRRLFFQMTGDLEEKSQQRLVGSDEEPPIYVLPAKVADVESELAGAWRPPLQIEGGDE